MHQRQIPLSTEADKSWRHRSICRCGSWKGKTDRIEPWEPPIAARFGVAPRGACGSCGTTAPKMGRKGDEISFGPSLLLYRRPRNPRLLAVPRVRRMCWDREMALSELSQCRNCAFLVGVVQPLARLCLSSWFMNRGDALNLESVEKRGMAPCRMEKSRQDHPPSISILPMTALQWAKCLRNVFLGRIGRRILLVGRAEKMVSNSECADGPFRFWASAHL